MIRSLATHLYSNLSFKYELQSDGSLMINIGENAQANQPVMKNVELVQTSSDCRGMLIEFAHDDKNMMASHAKDIKQLIVNDGNSTLSAPVIWAGNRRGMSCMKKKFCECYKIYRQTGTKCTLDEK